MSNINLKTYIRSLADHLVVSEDPHDVLVIINNLKQAVDQLYDEHTSKFVLKIPREIMYAKDGTSEHGVLLSLKSEAAKLGLSKFIVDNRNQYFVLIEGLDE